MTLSEKAVHPLKTLDPAAAQDDLTWLDDVVGDARVVAIGESSHDNAESYLLRHRLFRYLVEHHDFTAFVMESGYAEGVLVDRWIKGDDTRPLADVMANGFTYIMGLWTEMRAQLEWMRQYNQNARLPISFHGMDVPGSMASLLPALDAVIAYLNKAEPEYVVDPTLRTIAESWAGYSSFSAPQAAAFYLGDDTIAKNTLTAGLARLVSRLRSNRLEYVKRTSAAEFTRAFRTAELAAALDQMWSPDVTLTMSTRDSTMAGTVQLLANQEKRIVVAAHNAHIQRWPTSLTDPPATSMGMYLEDIFGADYRVIATTTGQGQTLNANFVEGPLFIDLAPAPADTLDGVLSTTADGPFGINLRTLSPADQEPLRSAKKQRVHALTVDMNALTAYDALIHLPTVTVTTPDPAALAASPEEVQDRLRP